MLCLTTRQLVLCGFFKRLAHSISKISVYFVLNYFKTLAKRLNGINSLIKEI